MKIVVPVNKENKISEHFGQSENFNVFTVSEGNKVSNIKSVAKGHGCGCKSGVSSELSSDGVTVMLAGGIGGGAVKSFMGSGIEVLRGCSGDAGEVVSMYLSGQIEDRGSSCSKHQEHHHHDEHQHGHSCCHN